LGTNKDAIGSRFAGAGGLSGSDSVVVEISARNGCLFEAPARLGEYFGGEGEDTAPAQEGEAAFPAMDEIVEEAIGRRWTTLFTVTRLVPVEGGRNCIVALGGVGRMQYFFPFWGIGGIMRALYMFFWSLDASVRVFWKRDLGAGFEPPRENVRC